jgi:hypothetical protein
MILVRVALSRRASTLAGLGWQEQAARLALAHRVCFLLGEGDRHAADRSARGTSDLPG